MLTAHTLLMLKQALPGIPLKRCQVDVEHPLCLTQLLFHFDEHTVQVALPLAWGRNPLYPELTVTLDEEKFRQLGQNLFVHVLHFLSQQKPTPDSWNTWGVTQHHAGDLDVALTDTSGVVSFERAQMLSEGRPVNGLSDIKTNSGRVLFVEFFQTQTHRHGAYAVMENLSPSSKIEALSTAACIALVEAKRRGF